MTEEIWVLPTQFGKTFEWIEEIKKLRDGDIHFVFTLNLIHHVEQFAARVRAALPPNF